MKRYKELLYNLFRDNNFIFIVLAAVLVSVYIFYPAANAYQRFINIFPYAFGWFVFAWAITDKSISQRIFPYLGLFVILFFEKSYWHLFLLLYPPAYAPSSSREIADAFALGFTQKGVLFSEWFILMETAQYIFIIVKFFVMFIVFLTIWYLARPSDFKELKTKKSILQSKKMILLVAISFIMTISHWLWRFAYRGLAQLFTHYWEMIPLSQFLFYGLPTAVAFILFAVIITKIQSRAKYLLYAIIGLFAVLPYLYENITYGVYTNWTMQMLIATSVLAKSISYFFVFLSFFLLAKSKYIER